MCKIVEFKAKPKQDGRQYAHIESGGLTLVKDQITTLLDNIWLNELELEEVAQHLDSEIERKLEEK